ncbi:unnamed protein product [Triticum turgidum subsp. durum]|uniref:BHLH domain-containing protein n=1 Tax=Triticum turgidum subsp. durum TaxID=4567 RepID=A0A9R1RBE3_TRITD|nr:unnamed protein product [Triticum turgidum subsp. durum]
MKYEELFPVETRKFGYDPSNAARTSRDRTVEQALDDRVRKKADRYCNCILYFSTIFGFIFSVPKLLLAKENVCSLPSASNSLTNLINIRRRSNISCAFWACVLAIRSGKKLIVDPVPTISRSQISKLHVFSNVRACPDAPSLGVGLSTAKAYFMDEHAPEIPVSYSSSSTSPASSVWESHEIIQKHAPFPLWSPHTGTLLASAATDPATFCEDPSSPARTHLPSRHLWNQTDLSMGAHGSSNELGGSSGHGKDFLSLLEARTVMPEMLDDFSSAACDYLKGMDGSDYNSISGSASYGFDSGGPYAGPSALPKTLPTSVAIHGSPLGYSGFGSERVFQEGRVMQVSFGARISPDAIYASGYRSKTELSDTNQHEQRTVSARTGTGQSGAAGDPKKRKSEEKLAGNGKRSKKDTSSRSPPKAEVPDMKLGERDKIIALQQIISPYGKTDRASVLYETIKHIEYLHEQIQLLSEPYMKNSTNEVPFQWGGKEEDLRGRGLCLVPVSCTPQVLQDNSLPDCWTPVYKSSRYQ